MLSEATLTEFLQRPRLSMTDKLLLCLAVEPDKPKNARAIKELAVRAGLLDAKRWDVATLANTGGRTAHTKAGWVLLVPGREYVAKLTGTDGAAPAPHLPASLRRHLSKFTNRQTAAFVEEAIRCYEQKLFRAAVVLSWVGAVSVLYDFVIANRLADFNAKAQELNSKRKAAVTADDLSKMMGEADFLNILDNLSILGKNVKQQLGACLTLRNGCGHPNSLVIAEHSVASHLEVLLLNVFDPYAT